MPLLFGKKVNLYTKRWQDAEDTLSGRANGIRLWRNIRKLLRNLRIRYLRIIKSMSNARWIYTNAESLRNWSKGAMSTLTSSFINQMKSEASEQWFPSKTQSTLYLDNSWTWNQSLGATKTTLLSLKNRKL